MIIIKLSAKRIIFLAAFIFQISTCIAQTEIVGKYNPIDLRKDRLFSSYFTKFKYLVKKQDKNALAKLFFNSYPNLLVVLDKGNDNKNQIIQVKIKNKSDFLYYYPRIFDKRMRDVIGTYDVKDLSLMEGGISLDRGQVWWLYNNKTKVIKVSYLANTDANFPSSKLN